MEIKSQTSHEGYCLQSDRLSVQVASPGTVYRGSRFDWTGTVTQVTLDGRHTFCTLESLVPGQGTSGIGLCNEFGIAQPVGYEEASVGGKFPKLGIGLLTRLDEDPYLFTRPYPVEPFNFEVETGEGSLSFTVHPQAINGYAVRLKKKLSVANNQLSFAYELQNVGEKPVTTNEYGHNFVNVNGVPIGPGYRLRLPQSFKCEPEHDSQFNMEAGEISWKHVPSGQFSCRSNGPFPPGMQWELVHELGIGLRETVDFSPRLIAVWGTEHVVSPEVFLQVELQPGEIMRWTRKIEFFADA